MLDRDCKKFVFAIMAVLGDLTLTRERRGAGERLVAGMAGVLPGRAVGLFEVTTGEKPTLQARWIVGERAQLKMPEEWSLEANRERTEVQAWVTEDWNYLTSFPISGRQGALTQMLLVSGELEEDRKHMLAAALGVYAHHLWLVDENHPSELAPFERHSDELPRLELD